VIVWLVSPAWGRLKVSALALAERRWLCDELAKRGHEGRSVIVADDENLELAREFGFDALEFPNDDLGEKFNAGFRYAADHGADIFCHVGSDDWVHPSVFDVLDRFDISEPPLPVFEPGQSVVLWRAAPCVVTQRTATIVDMGTGRMQRITVSNRFGVIPWLMPRNLLERDDFSPIPAGFRRGIDGALISGLSTRPNWVFQDHALDTLVDWKSPTNLTPYDHLAGSLGDGQPVAISDLASSYPADLVALAEEACMAPV